MSKSKRKAKWQARENTRRALGYLQAVHAIAADEILAKMEGLVAEAGAMEADRAKSRKRFLAKMRRITKAGAAASS